MWDGGKKWDLFYVGWGKKGIILICEEGGGNGICFMWEGIKMGFVLSRRRGKMGFIFFQKGRKRGISFIENGGRKMGFILLKRGEKSDLFLIQEKEKIKVNEEKKGEKFKLWSFGAFKESSEDLKRFLKGFKGFLKDFEEF